MVTTTPKVGIRRQKSRGYNLYRVWEMDKRTGKWEELAALQIARNIKEVTTQGQMKAELVLEPLSDEQWQQKVGELQRKAKITPIRRIRVSEAPKAIKESEATGYIGDDGIAYVIPSRAKKKEYIEKTAEHELAHLTLRRQGLRAKAQGEFSLLWDEIETRILTNKAFGWPNARDLIDEIGFYLEEGYHPSQRDGVMHWLRQMHKLLYSNFARHLPKGWEQQYTSFKNKVVESLDKYQRKEMAEQKRVEEGTKKVTTPKQEPASTVIVFRKIHGKRSERAQAMDEALTSRNVVTPRHGKLWRKNPNRFDIPGIDAPVGTKVTMPKQKTSGQTKGPRAVMTKSGRIRKQKRGSVV